MTYLNGDKYEGDWVENKRHGFGTYFKLERGRHRVEYHGTFVEGKREGFGVFFSPEGERYEGEWTASKRHGRGRQTFAPKPGDDPDLPGADVYEGDWVMDERTGSGVMRYANGDVWTGEWVKGEKHGAGTFFNMQNRTRYEGVWERGTPRCGTYETMEEGEDAEVFLPKIELTDPRAVELDSRRDGMRRVKGGDEGGS